MALFAGLWMAMAMASALTAAADAPGARPDLEVRADFPGGSVHVDAIDQAARVLRVQPADHPDRGWRCWWYFKVAGLQAGETLTVEVAGGAFALPDRAATSADGAAWTHTEPGKRAKGSVTYTVPAPGREVYVAWGPPFLPADTDALLERARAACPHAAAFDLSRTREDRPVRALRVDEPAGAGGGERFAVWVQARQHAWESGSSWVADGLVDWLCSADERAAALRRRAVVVVVPIMDVDNVVRGAGGKNQKPQDHNRDWSDAPHWPSVAAAQQALRRLEETTHLALFLDLHNPDAGARQPFFYVAPPDLLADLPKKRLEDFLAAARADMTGPLAFTGQTKVSGPEYDKVNWRKISKNWVTEHLRDPVVAVTLETAWNTPHSTRDGYRQVGRGLGLAVERFLAGLEQARSTGP